jgi:hypothetical protein
MRPVVQSGAFEAAIGDVKAQLAHQMELTLEPDARASDVAGVGTNFGLDKNDVKAMLFHNGVKPLTNIFLTG